jgi:hypothetical protein
MTDYQARYDAHIARCIADLGEPTPQQITALQQIFAQPVSTDTGAVRPAGRRSGRRASGNPRRAVRPRQRAS